MHGFSGMQECTGYAEALHARNRLPPHKAALPHTADEELPTGFVDAPYALDGLQ